MDLRAIIDRSDIEAVWRALGGPEIRSNRGRAFWRGGRNANVALYPSSRSWRDFKTNDGGGILDLIQRVTGLSRQDAARWLADFHGVSMDQHACTRQAWHRADAIARTLATEQDEIIRFLRAVRNRIRSDCRALSAWATRQGRFGDDQFWREASRVDDRLRLADAIDEYIRHLQTMGAGELLALLGRLRGGQS